MKKRYKLETLKKRIKKYDSKRWEILENAGWRCEECKREYTGRATLVVFSKNNTVLCKRCFANHASAKIPGKKIYDKNAVIERVMKSGNMSEVADEHGVSRERIRQIVMRYLAEEIKAGLENGSYDNPKGKSINQLAKQEIRGFRKNRKRRSVYIKLLKAKENGVSPERFTSQSVFAQKVGLSVRDLQRYAPNVLNIVRENVTTGQGGKKWSRHYLRCRNCGTTSIRHHSYGYCLECYIKTDHFKAIQEASRLRNFHRWKVKQLKYQENYYNKKNFGGNRKKVLQRDDYKCVKCSLSDKEHRDKYGKSIYVVHLQSTSDHSMSNMATMCQSCALKLNHSKISKKL